ncbi:MAG: Modification methylase DpnIIB [Parcubacteria group bacterium ADurb.Bin216]|nr:MAG: Modification methylase DpnIIB [Parcubacteria group bacterium ADurb.Bin216]
MAKKWEGWGTALKPALEPITVARKPLGEKSVAENCLKWGVGGINIDGCRVGHDEPVKTTTRDNKMWLGSMTNTDTMASANPTGRFPANLIHDGSDEVVELFPQTKGATSRTDGKGVGMFASGNKEAGVIYPDSGSASRFFYCAKASKRERNIGCEGLEEKEGIRTNAPREDEDVKTPKRTNNHPTVKPIALMEYLVKLVSREGQVVLDPFMGSGTTGMACKKLDREFIGIEMMPDYMEIAKARIEGVELSEEEIMERDQLSLV